MLLALRGARLRRARAVDSEVRGPLASLRPFMEAPMRALRLPILALAVPALVAGACGKDDNAHPPSVVEFPHAFPEAPRELTSRNAPAWTSGHGIAATDKWLYVTDRDNKALVRMDRETLAVEKTLPLGSRPEQLVVGPDGAVIVTLRSTGEVVRVEDMKITQRVHLGVESWGVALSDDGMTAYVTLPREGQLVSIDGKSLEELDRVATLDEPRGVTFTPSMFGQPAFVTAIHQHTGEVQFEVDQDGLANEQRAFDISLRNGNPADFLTQTRLHGLQATRALAGTVNPENGQVYVAHVVAAPGTEDDFRASEVAQTPDGGTPVDTGGGGYGSTATPGASVTLPTRPVEVTVTGSTYGSALNAESEFPVQDPASGENMLALIDQPSDIAAHPTHTLLFMTGYGTDNVLVMSTAEADPVRSPIGVISVGHAPRAIAFSPDGKTAYVVNDFDLSVSEIDVTPFLDMRTFANPGAVGGDLGTSTGGVPMAQGSANFAGDMACVDDARCGGVGTFAGSDPTPSSLRVDPIRVQAKNAVAFGVDPVPAQIRRGARVYTYARNENLSHAGQFACASCHFEGRED
ncbi:MAG: beta-propeller fold lactonase family protein, partial [Myxococcota bacterium]